MKTAILLCAFVVSIFVNCVGQLQNMITDGDELLKSAKKVSVFIELGHPASPAAARYLPDFARAKRQVAEKLSKAKLETAANPADADIVIVVHELNEGTNGATICLGDELDVFKGGKAPSESDTPIWSVNEYCGISWPLNRALDKLIKAMKSK